MTLRLDLPADKDPISWVWGEAVPGIAPAASRFSDAVYAQTTLGLREFEAARTRIAAAGCARALRDGYHNDHQVELILERVQHIFPNIKAAPRVGAAVSG